MNKAIGMALLITGVLMVVCGTLVAAAPAAAVDAAEGVVNVRLFLGGGLALAVVGALVYMHVRLAPPGKLMTRRGEEHRGDRS